MKKNQNNINYLCDLIKYLTSTNSDEDLVLFTLNELTHLLTK